METDPRLKWPLSKLRKHQRIIQAQIEIVASGKRGNAESLAKLQQWDKEVSAIIDIKTFK